MLGGGDKLTSHIQEFSLFSSLGVTEIAPWLSDENASSDSHHLGVNDHKPSHLSNCVNEISDYEERIGNLEEITRRLEQKVRNLETKQKDKDIRNRPDNIFSGPFSDLKETKDISQVNENKDMKSGALNVERFRTLEGRQAFQQSKFSSLDMVFGGSSSSVWSKGKLLLSNVISFNSTCRLSFCLFC